MWPLVPLQNHVILVCWLLCLWPKLKLVGYAHVYHTIQLIHAQSITRFSFVSPCSACIDVLLRI